MKGTWHYLYRAVDSEGNTFDWMLSEKRNQEAAERFFKQLLSNNHCSMPRVMNFDKNPAYPPAFKKIKDNGLIPEKTELRQVKYLNNMIEQDHRFIKRKIAYSQWLQTFETAKATISGYESMHMIRKGQIKDVGKKDIVAQKSL